MLNRVCRALTMALLVGIVCSNAVELVLRSVFAYSLSWIFEVNLLLATWLYFIGVCQVYYRKGDIAVDVLSNYLPPPTRPERHRRSAERYHVCRDRLVRTSTGIRAVADRTPGVGLPSALYTAPVITLAPRSDPACLRKPPGRRQGCDTKRHDLRSDHRSFRPVCDDQYPGQRAVGLATIIGMAADYDLILLPQNMASSVKASN
jgi:hypothetical protein